MKIRENIQWLVYGIRCRKDCGRKRIKFRGQYYCPDCDRDKLEAQIYNEGY